MDGLRRAYRDVLVACLRFVYAGVVLQDWPKIEWRNF